MSSKAKIALTEGSMTTGIVVDIWTFANDTAGGFTLPANHILWDCGQYPVAIGDTWTDGVFTREGEPLTPIPTEGDRISALEDTTDNTVLEMMADHEYRISLVEMGLTESDMEGGETA